MRIISMLSWYQEPVSWLAECVSALSKISDHVVAVDGPYWGFPGAVLKPASGPEQADVIARTAAGLGMGCTIHTPRKPWSGPNGGEVAKRDWMMQAAMLVAEPGDWLLRVDADEVFTAVPSDIKQRLADTDKSVAEVMLWEREAEDSVNRVVDVGDDYESPLRCLFRAIPGIRIEGAHFVVSAPVDGERRFLVGHNTVPAEPLWDVRLEHRTRLRSPGRKRLKNEYSPLINQFEKVEDTPRND